MKSFQSQTYYFTKNDFVEVVENEQNVKDRHN